MHFHRIIRNFDHLFSRIRVHGRTNRRRGSGETPSCVSGAEVEMRVGRNFGGGGSVRWCGRGDEFPGEEVGGLKVGDAEFWPCLTAKA